MNKIEEDKMTALETMNNERIFSLEKVTTPNGEIIHFIMEECDENFAYQFDKEFILKLADELKQYAEENM